MRLRRGSDWSTPSWEDCLRLWLAILAAAFCAVVFVLFGWAFDSVSASIGEVRYTVEKWRGRA